MLRRWMSFAFSLGLVANECAVTATAQSTPLVEAQPDGLIVAEAEEFQPSASGGWQAKKWGENYYAATFANSFLSRKAFLGASEHADNVRAVKKVKVPAAGKYLVLARYEAAYRFETQFTIVVEQAGKQVLSRQYGARKNLKIWAFKQGLKDEIGWDWGATENVVWEGHDAYAELQPGEATITLIANKQPEPAAKRNVDLVMLTTDEAQIKMRLEKENYLPLDGMLTQSGDVWLRVTNTGDKPLTFKSGAAPSGGNWTEHSPYWVHLRQWKPVVVKVEPGQTSEWVEVGGLMDSLNDGRWSWLADGKFKAEFGLKASGQVAPLATFEGAAGELALAGDADTRTSKRLRKIDGVLYDLLGYLKQQPQSGRTPTRTPIFASTFEPLKDDSQHAAAVAEFKSLFGIAQADGNTSTRGRGYIDVRGVATDKLAEYCQKLGADAQNIKVVSLGDEIALPNPPKNPATHAAFREWLKARGLAPTDIDPAVGGDWMKIEYAPEADKKTKPGTFYWSHRYQFDAGIKAIKERTDVLRKHLPNAGIGANYSPHYPKHHMFLGEVHKWATVFREDGMTLPWGEDYIWQVAVGSPQVNGINLDLFRAGLRGKSDRSIHYYVMPHAPNNTPNMWRRLFYQSLAHGMKQVNLFEFRPVQVAYTENHCSDPAQYAMILKSFRELGVFEDFIQDGQVRAAETGLWFSETGDVWGDSAGSFAAAKRLLYLGIRNQQVPLDFIIEPDALDGTLSKYKQLFLTDRHVSRAASTKIAEWVKAGGRLVATAGAGMRDELDRPNEVLQTVLGVQETDLIAPEDKQFFYEKQDLPFAEPLETIASLKNEPVISAKSKVTLSGATTRFAFNDGSPAVAMQPVGAGKSAYIAYLPSLGLYKSAIPKKPVDRGSTEDAMIHFLPTDLSSGGSELFGAMFQAITLSKPVVCSAPFIESTVISSKHGHLIPLINWTRTPAKSLKVTLDPSISGNNVSLASGGKVDIKKDGGNVVVTLDLDVADALIVRP